MGFFADPSGVENFGLAGRGRGMNQFEKEIKAVWLESKEKTN